MQWLDNENVVGIFIAPPCGTASERGRSCWNVRRLVTRSHSGQTSIPMGCPTESLSTAWRFPRRTSYTWVVRGGYRRVFFPYLKIEKIRKTDKSKIQNQNCRVWKIQVVGFVFFLQFVSWFPQWTRGWLFGLFLNLSFLCILYFWNFGFVFFFVFCIFEIVDSFFFCILYFWAIAFVFFSYFFSIFSYFFCKNTKEKRKNTNKIQKIHFAFLYFFWYFSITSKNAICIFVFFCIFPVLHRLHFVLLYYFRSLDRPSKNKTTNPSMYVVFSFC